MDPECPRCHSTARRERTCWYEQWAKRVTRRRPFRCDACRRRFWAPIPAENAEGMEARELERMLRDVAISHSLRITVVRVQRLTTSWLVTITDQADRIVSTRLPDGPAAEIRAALLHWYELHS